MIEALIKLKIPTIVLVGVILWFGCDLVSKSDTYVSPSAVFGGILIVFGIFMGIFAFIDYRYKEQTDGVIEHLNIALSAISRTVKSSATTNQKVHKTLQDTLKADSGTIGKANRTYTVQSPGGTSTTEPDDE